ncbi:MAG: ABC transporter permease [Candidatus Bathyarchaeota archaeon]|nr:MAG: ABC transporter permease [Candidatus Bathyarchaeota archaeon]
MRKSARVNSSLAFFKAEVKKVWSRPILELAVVLLAVISFSGIQTLVWVGAQSQSQLGFQELIVNGVSAIMSRQMQPLIILCSILMSLSFARDYEQGLLQSMLSLPISRSSLFATKFLAVILPLTFLSWGFILFFSMLNYYSNPVLVIQFSIVALPIAFLSLLFYGGLATLISLMLKRTIPSALTAMLAGFFFWFITTLDTQTIGNTAGFLFLTPYKAPLVLLDRTIGVRYPPGSFESSLPIWIFATLTVIYALILVFPSFVYFVRRFEVRE